GTMAEQLRKCATAVQQIRSLYPPANPPPDGPARIAAFYQAYLDLRKAVGDDIKATSDPACKPQSQLPTLFPPIGPNQGVAEYERALNTAADGLKTVLAQSRLAC